MDLINYLKFANDFINLKNWIADEIQYLSIIYIEKPKLFEKCKLNLIYSKDEYIKIRKISEYFTNK